jgi:hypothetical protein
MEPLNAPPRARTTAALLGRETTAVIAATVTTAPITLSALSPIACSFLCVGSAFTHTGPVNPDVQRSSLNAVLHSLMHLRRNQPVTQFTLRAVNFEQCEDARYGCADEP